LFEAGRIEVSEISGRFPEMHGYIWRSLLLRRVEKPGKKLFIYHQGHDGNPFAYRQPNSVITHMIELGYDILVLCMPGYGWNPIANVRVKTWDGWGYLPALLPDNHAPLAIVNTGDGHFSKFFVLPVVSSIDLALSQRPYQQITMLGHSGGGWTTTLSAAVDPRIDNSIAYAGSLPFFARLRAVDVGDAEQFDTAFYRDFPYTTLYELASWNAGRKRIHYQLYNKNDDCCFSGESAEIFSRYLQAKPMRPERDLRMVIVNNSGHYMAVDAVKEIFRDIETSAATGLQARHR
jgi:pimeloyl-ACP methyl ester carboxylesterase